MAFNVDIQVFIDAINKLSDAEKVEMSQWIYQDYLQASEITKYHSIVEGVKCNTPIPFANTKQNWNWGKNGASRASNCDEILTDIGAKFSTKTWQTQTYTNTVEECFKDIACDIKDYFNSEKCNDSDPSGSTYLSFLEDMVGQALRNSWWTKTYFANLASADESLNGHDGVFTQMLAIAPPGSEQRIEIAANAGLTYVDQDNLGATVGLDTYKEMVKRARKNVKLRSRTDLEIRTTRVLAQNYHEWLQEEKQIVCCEKDPLTGTYNLESLTMFGVPIRIVDEWDAIIQNEDNGVPVFPELNDGTRWTDPHRAILSYVGNEPIGTCQAGELGDLSFKYNEYTELFKVKTEYDFDVKVLQDEDFILAL